MSDQASLFEDATNAIRSTPSTSKLSFLEGLFATWVAREQGRAAPNGADRKQAKRAAEAALRELGTIRNSELIDRPLP